MIRAATLSDVPAMVALGAREHARSHWHGVVPFNADDCAASFRYFIETDTICTLVAEQGGAIVGMIIVVVFPMYFNASAQSAHELNWYCESPVDAFALEAAARQWASEKGCAIIAIGAQEDARTERLEHVYARKGYHPFSRNYMKVL